MTDLYSMTIPLYKRTLSAAKNNLIKGKAFFISEDISPDEIVNFRLVENMLPFSFQINSIRHHSLNAVKGILEGKFSPPKPLTENTYEGMITVVSDALLALDAFSASELNDRVDHKVIFEMGDTKIPFTSDNFVTSFSLPNLYFHATTLYNMLRIHNVPLGKRDFLGDMAIG